jgi:hypothetical protein
MLAGQRVTGLDGVVERPGVQMPQVTIDAGVLDVTAHAFGRLPVNTLPGGDPLCHGRVARQAPRGRHLATGFVTLLALSAFELPVGTRQGPRRQERPELTGRRRAGRQQEQQAGQYAVSP